MEVDKPNVPLPCLFHRKIGNIFNTKFLVDPWCDEVPLPNRFPRLAALEVDKSCRVAQRLSISADRSFLGWNLQWCRPLTRSQEISQIQRLVRFVRPYLRMLLTVEITSGFGGWTTWIPLLQPPLTNEIDSLHGLYSKSGLYLISPLYIVIISYNPFLTWNRCNPMKSYQILWNISIFNIKYMKSQWLWKRFIEFYTIL